MTGRDPRGAVSFAGVRRAGDYGGDLSRGSLVTHVGFERVCRAVALRNNRGGCPADDSGEPPSIRCKEDLGWKGGRTSGEAARANIRGVKSAARIAK